MNLFTSNVSGIIQKYLDYSIKNLRNKFSEM